MSLLFGLLGQLSPEPPASKPTARPRRGSRHRIFDTKGRVRGFPGSKKQRQQTDTPRINDLLCCVPPGRPRPWAPAETMAVVWYWWPRGVLFLVYTFECPVTCPPTPVLWASSRAKKSAKGTNILFFSREALFRLRKDAEIKRIEHSKNPALHLRTTEWGKRQKNTKIYISPDFILRSQ